MILVVLGSMISCSGSFAQPVRTTNAGAVALFVDGRQVNWPVAASFPTDSLEAAGLEALRQLGDRGYLFARVDSVTAAPVPTVFVSQGPLVKIGDVRFVEVSPSAVRDPVRLLDVRSGDRFAARDVERNLLALLEAYDAAGHPLAEARIAAVELIGEERDEVILTIEVDPGTAVTVGNVELPGAARTRPGFVARLAGLHIGRPLADFDAEEIRETLLATNFFEEVGQPEIRRDTADRVTVVIPIRESAPGNFDLVMGYTPETSSANTGGLVGNGHLRLRNLFGGGRDMRLRLNRLPGRVSNVDVTMADPAVVGLPVGLEGSFRGVQQDSTYDQQQYGIHVTYALSRNLSVVAGATREVTKPGQAGLVLRSGEQRIPRSTATFLGAGVRFESVDWPANPRRGLTVETMFERGNKNRTARRVEAAGDTLTERTRNRQERLRVLTRYFVPLARRQAVVIGLDARLLLSDDYDESDLIRFGGANSLRGYNEEQFLGRLAGRALLEVRHLLDRYAYAFVFADLGYLEVPETPDLASDRRLLPGFGFGIQFRTPVGLVNATYAFNDSDRVSDGRVHVGLSFNL